MTDQAHGERRAAMPRWMVIAFVGTGLVLAGGLAVLLSRPARPGAASALTPDSLLADWAPIPSFRLTDQDGVERTEALLDGRVTIVDFIFTNCPYACPGMTAEMADLAKALAGTGVRFVSFSVDPEHDTPDRLREFAAREGADTTRWTFLTGDFEAVRRIASETLMFAVEADERRPIELADGTTMNNVVHPTKLFLVGPDRRVISMYEYTDPVAMLSLRSRARAAAELLARRGR